MSNLWENFSPWTYDPTYTGDTKYRRPDDNYAKGSQTVLSFYHLPSGREIYFKAFITTFTETTSPNWSGEKIYGRSDPVQIFKNTSRKISLGFQVPAANAPEAYENLAKIQLLAQFLYPTYIEHKRPDNSSAVDYRTITQSPFVRLKVMNLLASTAGKNNGGMLGKTANELYDAYGKDNAPNAETGQLGVIHSVQINHNLEGPQYGAFEKSSNTILPKMLEVNIDFSPIHEQTLGWAPSGKDDQDRAHIGFLNDGFLFPYGAVTEEMSQHQQASGTVIGVPEEMEVSAATNDEELPTGIGSEQDLAEAAALLAAANALESDVATSVGLNGSDALQQQLDAQFEEYAKELGWRSAAQADRHGWGAKSEDAWEKPEGTLPDWDDIP